MAIAVESPSIASAREKAASILYGNEKVITPVVDPEPELVLEPEVKTTPKYKLASYQPAEPVRAVARPTQFRKYESIAEPVMTQEPQVWRPYDNPTVINATTVDTITAPVAVTTQEVVSEIDQELEADTQYVVKFKTSTIVAGAAIATLFLLMTILFIVNIVSLVTSTATVNALVAEEQTLQQTLDQNMAAIEAARQQALATAGKSPATSTIYLSPNDVQHYAQGTTTNNHGTFFNWLCNALSSLGS